MKLKKSKATRAKELAGPVLYSALVKLLSVSRCQNGCAPDDMTCATNVADAALKRVRTFLRQPNPKRNL